MLHPHVLVVGATIVFASALPLQASPLGMSALEVHLSPEPPLPADEWGCGPPRVLLSMTSSAIHIGEEAGDVVRHATVAAAAAHLRRLKDARPERTELFIEAADDVRFERLVSVIDVARGFDFLEVAFVLDRGSARFEDFGWRRPPPRRELTSRARR